jgi:hypothetical protein
MHSSSRALDEDRDMSRMVAAGDAQVAREVSNLTKRRLQPAGIASGFDPLK